MVEINWAMAEQVTKVGVRSIGCLLGIANRSFDHARTVIGMVLSSHKSLRSVSIFYTIHMLNDILWIETYETQLYIYKTDPQSNSTTSNWTQRTLCSLLSTTNHSLLSLLGSPRCHKTIFDGWERVAPLKNHFRRFWVSRPKLLAFSTPGSDSFSLTKGFDPFDVFEWVIREKWRETTILTKSDQTRQFR